MPCTTAVLNPNYPELAQWDKLKIQINKERERESYDLMF